MTNRPDLCILFAYHRNDELTRYHLALLRTHNPDVPIIPITESISDYLPGTVDVAKVGPEWVTEATALRNKRYWYQCDTMLYRWFINRGQDAERYLLLEYDCLCTQSVREAYRSVWNADVATADFVTPETYAPWSWFSPSQFRKMAPSDRPFAAGLVPYAGTLFSHHGLEQIVAHATHNDVFCELRLGTAACKAGLVVKTFPPGLRKTIQHFSLDAVPAEPGIYHSVKRMPGKKGYEAIRDRSKNVIWLASYPKSGNTWVRFMLANYILGNVAGSDQVARTIPDVHAINGGRGFRTKSNGKLYLMKTHWQFRNAMPMSQFSAGAVVIIRNPLDVLASAINYNGVEGGAVADYVSEFIRNGGDEDWIRRGFGTWISYVESILDAVASFPVLVVLYEKLVEDPVRELTRITRFCGLGQDRSRIADAVAASSLRALKSMEQSELNQGKRGIFLREHKIRAGKGGAFANRGGVGNYKEILTAEQVEFALRRFGPTMRRIGYQIGRTSLPRN